jgi:hypothetical protein
LYQVGKLDTDGFLEPDTRYPYFPLREDAAEAAHRGSYWTQVSPKDLVLIRVVFSPTLLPEVLSAYERGESTRYRLNGTLFKEYRSRDDILLYSVREEKLRISSVVVQ